jgi:hypothetical protein
MDPQRVLELCHEHAEAEALEDMDRVLATLCPDPRFEFFPMAKQVRGWENIETFYRTQYTKFAPMVVGYEVIGEWTNELAALQEYVIDLDENGTVVRYRIISMMPADEESGLLQGERLYCDDGFVRALLGPLADRLEPITRAQA